MCTHIHIDRDKWGSCHHGMARPQVADGGTASNAEGICKNILSKQLRTANKGWSSSLGVGQSANNSSPQKRILLQNVHIQSTSECGNGPSGSIKCGEFLD